MCIQYYVNSRCFSHFFSLPTILPCEQLGNSWLCPEYSLWTWLARDNHFAFIISWSSLEVDTTLQYRWLIILRCHFPNIVGIAPALNLLLFFIPNWAAMVASTSKQSSVKCSLQRYECCVAFHWALVRWTCFSHSLLKAGSLVNPNRLMLSLGVLEQWATIYALVHHLEINAKIDLPYSPRQCLNRLLYIKLFRQHRMWAIRN